MSRAFKTASRVLLGVVTRPSGALALVGFALLAMLAILGPVLWGEAARELNPSNAYAPASSTHWFGTDSLGRDVLARTLSASRLTLTLSVAAAGVGALIGAPLGSAIVLLGPRVRATGLRLIDVSLAFPPILVALLVTTVSGPGARGATLAIGFALAPGFARVASTLTASVAAQDYVLAAHVLGVSKFRILSRYYARNIADSVCIQAAVGVGQSLIGISSLSFLGLGVQPPASDWGRMLTEGVDNLYTAPSTAVAPAVAIAFTGLVFGYLGDVVATSLNPRVWTGSRQSAVKKGRRRWDDLAPTKVEDLPSPRRRRADELLWVERLSIEISQGSGTSRPVDGVSFSMSPGEAVGLVGESGSGKTLTGLGIAHLIDWPLQMSVGEMSLNGHDLAKMPAAQRDHVLASQLSVVSQHPLSSLNPALRIGTQLTEGARRSRSLSIEEAEAEAVQWLRDVQMPGPESLLRRYPHELSGGMQQRVAIAMALMSRPSLIVADEPTTALDVTVQAQILDVLRQLNTDQGVAILLISHDIAVISETCSRVMVMYKGRIVEDGPLNAILHSPAHPYTQKLIAAVPDMDMDADQPLATMSTSVGDGPPTLEGCSFADRCPLVQDRCLIDDPRLEGLGADHRVACWVALGNEGSEVAGHWTHR